MKQKVCIVIPVYKERLSKNEINALKRCIDLYGGKYDIFLVAPMHLNINSYPLSQEEIKLIRFKESYFHNTYTYNKLLLSPVFYKPFRRYKYMLIHQLDAFILKDELEEVCSWGYDFIGAPWLDEDWKIKMNKKHSTSFYTRFFLKVGNGGFSLRNIQKAYPIALVFQMVKWLWKKNWNEDIFWSTICFRLIPGYNVPKVSDALKFSVEDNPREALKINDNSLPFGCHAWEKNDPEFWKKHFKRLGYEMD